MADSNNTTPHESDSYKQLTDETQNTITDIHLLASSLNGIGLCLSSGRYEIEDAMGGLGTATTMLAQQLKQAGETLEVNLAELARQSPSLSNSDCNKETYCG